MSCAQLFKCLKCSPILENWLFPSFLPLLEARWTRVRLSQTAPTAGDRAGADCRPGIRAGTAGQRLHRDPPTVCVDPNGPPRAARWGVKGVQACRMLTIRQKTLIGFNWKSMMGLIASSPCCRPRMAPVIPPTPPHSPSSPWVADQTVKHQTDGLRTLRVRGA